MPHIIIEHSADHPVAISAEVQLIDPTMRLNRNHIRTHLVQPDET